MNPVKRISVVASMLLVMLGFLVYGISMLSVTQSERSNDTESSYDAVSVASEDALKAAEKESNYVLKIEDGIVVVFNDSDLTRPIIVTDIYASTLRHFDREQLNKGIVAKNDFELQCMLEDYSS